MDLSAVIVVIVLSALFIGFIVLLSIHSRRTAARKEADFNASQIGLSDK